MMKQGIWLAAVLGALGCGVQTSEEPLGGEGGSSGHDGMGGDAGGSSTLGEQIVDAPDASTWVNLKLGEPELQATGTDVLGWDLRVSRTMLGTNSGTSGEGDAGAALSDATSIEGAIVCPDDGYAADAMLPLPGPPGSGEFSGNPVLNDWYNYDEATHAVTTKGLVYCVRTAGGQFGAIRVKNYASGQMTLEWRFQPSGSTTL